MSSQSVPAHYQTVMPYLILKDTGKFMDYMKQVFGAEEKAKHLKEDGTVMHGELAIGSGTIMCGEASDQWKTQTAGLFIYVDSADESYKKAIAAGGKSIMDLTDQDYGRTCGVQDPFGNTWWITSIKK